MVKKLLLSKRIYDDGMTHIIKCILFVFSMSGYYGVRAQSAPCHCQALIRQYPITADSTKVNHELADEIKKVGSIYESDSDFEIRFYISSGITNGAHVKMISCAENRLKARAFHYWFKSDPVTNTHKINKVKVRKVRTDKDLSVILGELEKLYFFTLPDMEKLRPRMKKYGTRNGKAAEIRREILDGTGFTVQIKNGDYVRSYRYSNPGSYYKFYDDVEELKMADEIYKYFQTNLKSKKVSRLKYSVKKLFSRNR